MTVNLNLFGKAENPDRDTRVFIYCDEIKVVKNYLNEKWFYIGMLIIPEENKEDALTVLMKARDESNYYSELHFSGLTNFSYANAYNEKTMLAKKWVNLVLEDGSEKKFYFNILGINTGNLDWTSFGKKKEQFQNAYNRFFRTLLNSSVKYFFPGQSVIVVNLFHDNEQAMQLHKYFNWHAIYKLSKQIEDVHFESSSINFIDSNHNNERQYSEESHFIQLIDLLLGAFKQSFDKNCKRDGCNEIAQMFSPLLKKIIDNPMNKNSWYGYYRKYSFGFFPSQRLNMKDIDDDFTKVKSKIFQRRPLPYINQGQGELF